jgi:hypothetical protein
MVKYYRTTINKLYIFLRNIGYKNIYQINEFLIRGYIPCTDPYVIIVYDAPYLYAMKLNTLTNSMRCNIYYFVGSDSNDIEDIEDSVESFIDDECSEVNLKKKNISDKLFIDTYTNKSKYTDDLDSVYFANWAIKFI